MIHIKTFFIIILFYPIFLISQTPNGDFTTDLQYGTNHEDHISELGEVDKYSFAGNAGDVIMIRMRDETKVDSYIKLYDPDGTMVESAWSDGGLAKIRNLTLSKSGTYQIQVHDRNHNDIGKYGLSLHKLGSNDYSKPISGMTSFEDHIDRIVGVNMYKVEATKGDMLFTQMRALTVHLECEFYIYNSKGEELFKAVNKGRLATVGPVLVPATDTYTIVVTDRGGNDMDKFGLTHMLLNKHELATNLVCGDNINDNLGKLVQRNAFRLKTRKGQIPLVEARSNNKFLETTMMIFDEDGEIVRQKSATNKLLSEVLPVSEKEKSYLVVVYDRNGNDYGDFGLQVQYLDDSFCPDALNCNSQEVEIRLDGLAQNRLFSIEGIAGESIQVILKETEPYLEPHLRMYNLQGQLVAEKYDGVKADLSEQVFPEDGKYLILASDRSGNDIGTFSLQSYYSSDLLLEVTGCQTVYKGYKDEMAFADISVEASGTDLKFLWSTGETSQNIRISPSQSENVSVTVTNSSGCSSVATTFVEVMDVSCGNGNGSQKVQVCHVKNNGQHQTLCISVNGVDEHLDNGVGHEQCHIGPCDHSSACDEGDGKLAEKESQERNLTIPTLVFPNPTVSEVNIEMSMIPDEEVTISLFNVNGKRVLSEKIVNTGEVRTYNLHKLGLSEGIYILAIRSAQYFDTRQIILLR